MVGVGSGDSGMGGELSLSAGSSSSEDPTASGGDLRLNSGLSSGGAGGTTGIASVVSEGRSLSMRAAGYEVNVTRKAVLNWVGGASHRMDVTASDPTLAQP